MSGVKLKPHPVNARFPMMPPSQFAELVEDIRRNGQRQPIALSHDGRIVDGRNRYRACEKLGIEPKVVRLPKDTNLEAFCLTANLHRLHLDQSQRALLAAKLATLPNHRPKMGSTPIGVLTQPQAANLLNVGNRSINRARLVLESGDEDLIESVEKGQLSVFRAADQARRSRDLAAHTKVANAAKRALAGDDADYGVHVGDCRELSKRMPPNSVEMIYTDPPWGKNHLALYDALGEIAERVLKPSGSLVVYAGMMSLPQQLELLLKHRKLVYRWMFAVVFEGHTIPLVLSLKVINCWLCLLWFTKGKPPDRYVRDLVTSKAEKGLHPWQQSATDATVLIKALCPEGGLVYDPFVGSCSTGVACKRTGRRFIGHEIDPKTAAIARRRMRDEDK